MQPSDRHGYSMIRIPYNSTRFIQTVKSGWYYPTGACMDNNACSGIT